MNVIPIVMVKNEETWLPHVLTALAQVFDTILVGDTGSTDRTVELAKSVPIRGGSTPIVIEYGPQTPAGLTQVRQALTDEVHARNAEYTLLVDGDELYSVKALRQLLTDWPSHPFECGFVTMVSLDCDSSGTLWELSDKFNRLAIQRSNDRWQGEYPFEVPRAYSRIETAVKWYAPCPGLPYHAVHLHRLARSPHDDSVYMRNDKRWKFSLQSVEVPRTIPFDLHDWLST